MTEHKPVTGLQVAMAGAAMLCFGVAIRVLPGYFPQIKAEKPYYELAAKEIVCSDKRLIINVETLAKSGISTEQYKLVVPTGMKCE